MTGTLLILHASANKESDSISSKYEGEFQHRIKELHSFHNNEMNLKYMKKLIYICSSALSHTKISLFTSYTPLYRSIEKHIALIAVHSLIKFPMLSLHFKDRQQTT